MGDIISLHNVSIVVVNIDNMHSLPIPFLNSEHYACMLSNVDRMFSEKVWTVSSLLGTVQSLYICS